MKAPKRLTEAERDQLLLRLPVIERALAELLARSKPKKMPIDDTDRALVSTLFNTFSTDVFTRRDAIEHAAVNPHLKKALIDCNCDPDVGPDLAAHELQSYSDGFAASNRQRHRICTCKATGASGHSCHCTWSRGARRRIVTMHRPILDSLHTDHMSEVSTQPTIPVLAKACLTYMRSLVRARGGHDERD